jgi:hypothetical protein
MYTKTTISGIDLHWNYQKHFWFIYIKELLVQKYWQLISTKQLWSVRNIVSSKSRTVQYRVPRFPGQYRNVQDRVPRCPSQYRDVQVPRCLGPEMSSVSIVLVSRSNKTGITPSEYATTIKKKCPAIFEVPIYLIIDRTSDSCVLPQLI